ncbi:MAG: hypothetical protein Q8O94_01350 [bacterium]|nr:hypothetical protein [bacterium]
MELAIRIFAGIAAVVFVLIVIIEWVGELQHLQRRKKISELANEKFSLFTFRLIAGSLFALFFSGVLMSFAIYGRL